MPTEYQYEDECDYIDAVMEEETTTKSRIMNKLTKNPFTEKCICNWSKNDKYRFIPNTECPVHGKETKKKLKLTKEISHLNRNMKQKKEKWFWSFFGRKVIPLIIMVIVGGLIIWKTNSLFT